MNENPKILVIEDEVPLLEEVVDLLTFEGFDAIGAVNGQLGVRLAKEHKPDLILCDVLMPELDGYGVIIELQKDSTTSRTPFIFLTARAEKADFRKGMDLGADDYLTKPATREDLLSAIRSRLEKQAALTAHLDGFYALRETITRTMPHELRTPLAGIMGYADLILENLQQLERDAIGDMLQNIKSFSKRLHRLTENYLLYAQLELTRLDPEHVKEWRQYFVDHPSSPAEHIHETARRQASSAKRDADLILEISDAAIPIASEDLKKITEELLDNAFKFSDLGTPVRITAGLERDMYSICVVDQGRGMTEDQVSHIAAHVQFDRKVYEQQGAGLGLTIARSMIEMYDGSLTIQSSPGEGTSVCAAFPTLK